jgi:hypothetical protein
LAGDNLLPLGQYRAKRSLYFSTRRHTPCGGCSTTCATSFAARSLRNVLR